MTCEGFEEGHLAILFYFPAILLSIWSMNRAHLMHKVGWFVENFIPLHTDSWNICICQPQTKCSQLCFMLGLNWIVSHKQCRNRNVPFEKDRKGKSVLSGRSLNDLNCLLFIPMSATYNMNLLHRVSSTFIGISLRGISFQVGQQVSRGYCGTGSNVLLKWEHPPRNTKLRNNLIPSWPGWNMAGNLWVSWSLMAMSGLSETVQGTGNTAPIPRLWGWHPLGRPATTVTTVGHNNPSSGNDNSDIIFISTWKTNTWRAIKSIHQPQQTTNSNKTNHNHKNKWTNKQKHNN